MSDHTTGGIVCENGLKLCGRNCYDPKFNICIGGIVCENGNKKCGRYCFDPKFFTDKINL